MPKLSPEEIRKAVQKQAPGYEVAPEVAAHDDFVVQADAKAADRAALAKKYSKKRTRAADAADAEAPLEDDSIIVPIEGETAAGEKVRKTAVISSKTGDVTAIQG